MCATIMSVGCGSEGMYVCLRCVRPVCLAAPGCGPPGMLDQTGLSSGRTSPWPAARSPIHNTHSTRRAGRLTPARTSLQSRQARCSDPSRAGLRRGARHSPGRAAAVFDSAECRGIICSRGTALRRDWQLCRAVPATAFLGPPAARRGCRDKADCIPHTAHTGRGGARREE